MLSGTRPGGYQAAGGENRLEGDLGPYHYVSFIQSVPDLSYPGENCFQDPVQHRLSAGVLVLSE